MAITRIAATPTDGLQVDFIHVWTDEEVPWPNKWYGVDIGQGAVIYYNDDHSLFQPYALLREANRTGGIAIAGELIGPGPDYEVEGELDGLWSTRAGVFNRLVERKVIEAPQVVDVIVHDGPTQSRQRMGGVATSVKWLSLYSMLVRGVSDSADLPVKRKVTHNLGGSIEVDYEPVAEFDWSYEPYPLTGRLQRVR